MTLTEQLEFIVDGYYGNSMMYKDLRTILEEVERLYKNGRLRGGELHDLIRRALL